MSGKLVVFLSKNVATGACCNPNLTAEQALDLYSKVTWDHHPVEIKREGLGHVGITIDYRGSGIPKPDSLLKLLQALENIEFWKDR
jgi:hypothetical protein